MRAVKTTERTTGVFGKDGNRDDTGEGAGGSFEEKGTALLNKLRRKLSLVAEKEKIEPPVGRSFSFKDSLEFWEAKNLVKIFLKLSRINLGGIFLLKQEKNF